MGSVLPLPNLQSHFAQFLPNFCWPFSEKSFSCMSPFIFLYFPLYSYFILQSLAQSPFPDVSLQRQISFIWCLYYWWPWPSIWLCELWGRACCLLLVLVAPYSTIPPRVCCIKRMMSMALCIAAAGIYFTCKRFQVTILEGMRLNQWDLIFIGHMYGSNWCEKVKCHSYILALSSAVDASAITKTDYKHYFTGGDQFHLSTCKFCWVSPDLCSSVEVQDW